MGSLPMPCDTGTMQARNLTTPRATRVNLPKALVQRACLPRMQPRAAGPARFVRASAVATVVDPATKLTFPQARERRHVKQHAASMALYNQLL